jgi:hypothetical protein
MRVFGDISIFKRFLGFGSNGRGLVHASCYWNELADAADSQCPTCMVLREGFNLFESHTPAQVRNLFNAEETLPNVAILQRKHRFEVEIWGPWIERKRTYEFLQATQVGKNSAA